MRRRGGLLLPPLGRNVDDDDNNDATASGTPAVIGMWAKAEAADAVGTKQLRWADGVKLPKRDVSPTCVSRSSPYGVSGKEVNCALIGKLVGGQP